VEPKTSRKAVIVGVGQQRRNPKLDGPFDPQEPATMMAEAIRRALADATVHGANSPEQTLAKTQILACVDPLAWGYHDLFGVLADQIKIAPGYEAMMVPPGGNSPGDLMNQTMNKIVDGGVDVAIISGAECVYARRRARKEGRTLDWTPFEGHRDFMKGQRPLTNDLEARHGMMEPIQCYPLYENALRAKAGRTIGDHQTFLGEFMARNTVVAASNPHAWFPFAQTAQDIASPSADNRMIGFPYPKRMNAIMEVDLSAAMIVMSSDEADRQGIPKEHQVAVLGGAGAVDGWCPTERADFTSSPAIAAALQSLFGHAGCDANAIDLFDLYSCFPSAVQMALGELGVATNDPRGVTVTGGLAYAGGPGNNYALHGMAAMVERLRNTKDPSKTGLVSALGNTATKHAICLLSVDEERIQAADGRASEKVSVKIDAPTLVDERSGNAIVETYTALFDRTGAAERSIFVLRFEDGTRTVANGSCSDAEIRVLTAPDAPEPIGRRGVVTAGQAGIGDANVPNQFAFSESHE
jgi:acetyl-CoA C-acetyltransferase